MVGCCSSNRAKPISFEENVVGATSGTLLRAHVHVNFLPVTPGRGFACCRWMPADEPHVHDEWGAQSNFATTHWSVVLA